jgi:large subunit ribosomal protein L19
MIDKIEIVKRAKVRRAKLYYIREKVAREVKRQMRRMSLVSISTESGIEMAQREVEAAKKAEAAAKAAEEAEATRQAEEAAQAAEVEAAAIPEVVEAPAEEVAPEVIETAEIVEEEKKD